MSSSDDGKTSRGSGYLSSVLPSRYRFMRRIVDTLKPVSGVPDDLTPFIATRTLDASTLPSSTPHWSNELMFQIKPCTADPHACASTACVAMQ